MKNKTSKSTFDDHNLMEVIKHNNLCLGSGHGDCLKYFICQVKMVIGKKVLTSSLVKWISVLPNVTFLC